MPDLADELLRVAVQLGVNRTIPDLLAHVYACLARVDRFRMAAVGVHDERREVLVVTAVVGLLRDGRVDHGLMPAEGEEVSSSTAEVATLLADRAAIVSLRASDPAPSAIGRRLAQFQIDRYAALPLWSDGKLAGILFAGFESGDELPTETTALLETLARIVTPAFLNARTRERLSKGDKRRANLVELSHVINTSLELDAVLTDARKAIRSIEGHVVSAIGLREDSGDELIVHWEAYKQQEDSTRRLPRRLPIEGTAFGRVFASGATYESPDLRKDMPFAHDRILERLGVRRYTLAPMFTRGKVIGAFLFGTNDPYPSLTTDVWMHENIAMQLALAIDNARQFEELRGLSAQLAQQNVYLREEIATEHNVEGMVGQSTGIRRVLNQVVQVAPTDAVVLVLGETGVGKELVARAIHAKSSRADQPLVKLNCAAIPETLVESELFGHEKGAFTSATSRRVGRFELARDGTLFLDELGELPLAIQAKLLRVLQDGEFERIGGNETLRTNARIIAATNRSLIDEVNAGRFRSDLYYRLNVFPIVVPPLADRRSDIPLLVDAFINQFNRRMGKQVRAVDSATMDYLRQRPWPGNIRELRHVIERAMILCQGPALTIEPHEQSGAVEPWTSEADPSGLDDTGPDKRSLATLEAVERDHIQRVLRACDGVIEGPAGASAALGMKPSTLRSRMRRLGIDRRER